MDTIIQQFSEKIMSEVKKELDKIFLEGESDISQLINLVDMNLKDLGSNIIKYIIEESDRIIKESKGRKRNWVVQSKDAENTLLTEFGEVKYKRTYYKSKGSKGFTYLVDDYFGIERYQRIDKGLEAKIVELSKDHSYQKSADLAVKTVELSRQTVKNKIRKLGEIDNRKVNNSEEKRHIKRLYIEADEDHISLQNASNTIAKLVYVHEGIKKQGKRFELKNTHYFAGLYKDVEELWLEVLDYIYENYEVDEIETIYLAGDGAEWIKEGLNWLPRPKYILDRYHLNKYVLQATGHVPSLRFKLWDGLNRCDIDKVKEVFKGIIKNTERDTKLKAVKDARKYILNNWGGIEIYKKDSHVIGCSAEGHVSHVLSERMSSRPLGWSIKGADQMARLRAFKYNGGSKEGLYRLLVKKNEKKRKEKLEEILTRKDVKTLYPEAKETLPALNGGRVSGTFRAVKSLAF
jgi:hypothetical protein